MTLIIYRVSLNFQDGHGIIRGFISGMFSSLQGTAFNIYRSPPSDTDVASDDCLYYHGIIQQVQRSAT